MSKGDEEAYEVMVGCSYGFDDVGGGLRFAGCKGVVCSFKKRDRKRVLRWEFTRPERNGSLRR